ncbi:glycosyltransferase [Novosphingobium album (ex Hu et al. 2023)]|uniref:Glycosyltransferase n=1 Tax=Novosphingobium album (ex Hu et al. 2023) TaxID=2930093 RepID=A0ABT0B6G6_9SPHN|nr:glycosyltransferase [Novosphingobium album (ex Hu et al. 2023)]MCJ2180617.1 glycosyltransferase [Novosphingobium album (ex Hu et al. 2023)]
MSRIIAYDLTRLFIGPLFLTPRGIDRVDLALALHVFEHENTRNLGILPTPWGTRAYPAKVVRQLLEKLQQLWSEDLAGSRDPQLQFLIERIQEPFAVHQVTASPARLSLAGKVRRIVDLLLVTGLKLGRSAKRSVPRGAVYVNIGQLGLAVPIFHAWLEERRDLTCAIMLHDVIPLEYPHLVSKAAVGHHARMVKTAARHADCLLFNTEYARAGIDAALQEYGRIGVPSLVRSLPLPDAYAEAEMSVPELDNVNYFLVVSTIEPRKNHDLLLRVWKRLIKRMGVEAPHLIVVGARGYDSERILAPLDHDPVLQAHVHIVSGLSSAALASLTLGATGMLCPSLAEGFGLPVLEANALAVPTVASDIAAHREVGNDATIFLPTDDEIGWERAITGLPATGQRRGVPIAASLTEQAYCDDVLDFLTEMKI